MRQPVTIQALLSRDPIRLKALKAVAALALPDGWIGAGFVRDAVWDHLHGYEVQPPAQDVDVVWFAPDAPSADVDREIERTLRLRMPELAWSVKNQARMHLRNGDMPYSSIADAMWHWPETATAIAARLGRAGSVEINAPFGVDDLFALRLRSTPVFATGKWPIFRERIASKRWIARYPLLDASG